MLQWFIDGKYILQYLGTKFYMFLELGAIKTYQKYPINIRVLNRIAIF